MSDNEQNVGRADVGELAGEFENVLSFSDQQQSQTSTISQRVESAVNEFKKVLQLLTDSQRGAAPDAPVGHTLAKTIGTLQKEIERAAKQVLINLEQKELRTNQNRDSDALGFRKCKENFQSGKLKCNVCRRNGAEEGVTKVPVKYTNGLDIWVPATSCSSAVDVVYLIVCLTCEKTYVGQTGDGKQRWEREIGGAIPEQGLVEAAGSSVNIPEQPEEAKSQPNDGAAKSQDALKAHMGEHPLEKGEELKKRIWMVPLQQFSKMDADKKGVDAKDITQKQRNDWKMINWGKRQWTPKKEQRKVKEETQNPPETKVMAEDKPDEKKIYEELKTKFEKKKAREEAEIRRKRAECFWITMLEPQINRGV